MSLSRLLSVSPGRSCLLALTLFSACGSDEKVEDTSPDPDLRFVEVAAEAGVDFKHSDGRTGEFFYVESTSAGVIFFDADQDGDQDLFFTNGRALAEPTSPATPVNAFYLNDGRGNFTNATEQSGLGDQRYSMGVCAADYDNDGDVDLFVTNFDSGNALYRNDGNARFEDVAVEAGVTGARGFNSSCAFADVDNDGWVDLYVANCLDHTLDNNIVCSAAARDGSGEVRRHCNPVDYNPLPDKLYRNLGDGTFEDRTEAWGIAGIGRSLGVAFSDFDADGDQDIFIACDRTSNLYYENHDGERFEEISLTTGAAFSHTGNNQAGMGIVTGDYDGDGRIDVAVTYFEREWNGLYRNLGDHHYAEMARVAGSAEASRPLLAWGIELFDADLDGDLEMIVANGHLMDNIHLFREPIAPYNQPNLLYKNLGDGKYESVGPRAGPAFEVQRVSRGLAVADIDNDGDLDAVVANLNQRPELLRNESPRAGRHWLMIRTIGTKSNRDGIGARLSAHLPDGRVLVREVRSGQSYLSQSELRAHFGLGEASVLPLLEIRWPSGIVSRHENVAADQVLEITEPAE